KDLPVTGQSPWKTHGSQRLEKVYLLHGEGDCVPCLGEGCDRHINSLSECLQQLPVNRVIQVVEMMLRERKHLVRTSGFA
ncbi:MAG TPA: hypothetical protein VFX10_04645, partial [Nitrospira sp.]|nr:hypothetical protein [Nitrospira sp.]